MRVIPSFRIGSNHRTKNGADISRNRLHAKGKVLRITPASFQDGESMYRISAIAQLEAIEG